MMSGVNPDPCFIPVASNVSTHFTLHRKPLRTAAGLACIVVGLTLLFCDVEAEDLLYGVPSINQHSNKSLFVEVTSDILTVRAQDVTIIDLLEEIARQSGLVIVLRGPLEEQVNVDFAHLSLSRAMDRILRDHNFVIHYVPTPSEKNNRNNLSSSRLWVFSSISESDYVSSVADSTLEVLQHNPEFDHSSMHRHAVDSLKSQAHSEVITILGQQLKDEDSSQQLSAVFQLSELGGDEAVTVLGNALSDGNMSVKIEAVNALGEIGNAAAVTQLEKLLSDSSEHVREAVIDNLVDIGGEYSRQVLNSALHQQGDRLTENLEDAIDEIDSDLRWMREL